MTQKRNSLTMSTDIAVPNGWTIYGSLPSKDPSQLSESECTWLADNLMLTEDLLHIKPSSGEYEIDISWLPDSDPNGSFVCRIIKNQDWDSPDEEIEDRSLIAVKHWIENAISTIVSRDSIAKEPTNIP